MNVLIHASPSAPPGLSNLLRSILSPFYTVQSITSSSLATQPWTSSCALLVLPPPDTSPTVPLSLPKPAQNAVQEYIASGGRLLGIGQGVSLLPHRPAAQQGRFDLWDAKSGTAIVAEPPPSSLSSLSSSSSIRLHTGALLSGLRQVKVPFELAHPSARSESEIIIHAHWEEEQQQPFAGVSTSVAGVQVRVGSGRAAFWGVALDDDDGRGVASASPNPSVLAVLRYALTSLGLIMPATESPSSSSSSPTSFKGLPAIPQSPLPQFLLYPRGKRHIIETVLEKLDFSVADLAPVDGGEPGVLVFKDEADTFHFHRTTLSDGARLVAEARESTTASQHKPRIVIVLPPDELPPRELVPRFDVEKYFAVLAEEARGDRETVGTAGSSWGLGEALFYGEAVTSTQTMLDK
jgi:biotin---protein ligase